MTTSLLLSSSRTTTNFALPKQINILKAAIVLATVLLSVTEVKSAKILAIFQVASYSHQVVYQPIWRELSLRGHQVTVLTSDPLNDPSLTNLTEISWREDLYKIMRRMLKGHEKPIGVMEMVPIFHEMSFLSTEIQLSHPEVKRIIQNETEHFDLVITEWLFTGMAAFSERFNCPLVGLNSLGAFTVGHDTVGNPSNPAYNPDIMFSSSSNLTLYERVLSTLYSIWIRYDHHYNFLPAVDKMLRKHFGNDLSPMSVLEKRISLLILNVNSIFYTIRPNVPAVVELGDFGIHIKKPKPLPKDIKSYLDNSKNGVIYFSLGSNIRSSSLTPEKLDIIKQTLSDMPYDILWKFEDEQLPGKPANVRISKWLPQNDILGHPNIKLFITQGGLQSLEEALYNRVPVLGIPFFTEQVNNLKGAARYGFAKLLEFKYLTKDRFKSYILEVIQNPVYRKRTQEAADLVSDVPMKAVDKAVWWIEYVIRHKGADHLRSPAVDLPWYQYLLMDVFAILLLTASIILFVAYKVLQFTISYLNSNIPKLKKM